MAEPNITQAQTRQYSANVEALVQLKTSRLRMAVTVGNYTGEAAEVIKQVGQVDLDEAVTANADTNYGDVPHDARWVFPAFYDKALIIDDMNAVQTIADFKNPYAQALAYGVARRYERSLATAFFADAKTGKNAGTTTPFLAANQVLVTEGAAAATGMNLAKLLKGKQLLRHHYALEDTDEVWCAFSSVQELNLLKEIGVVSGDFNPNKPLGRGQIDSYAGVNFIVTEELPVDGSGYRRCPMWVRKGMHLGLWKMSSRVYEDPGKKLNWATMVKLFLGATRTQEKLVVEIPASES